MVPNDTPLFPPFPDCVFAASGEQAQTREVKKAKITQRNLFRKECLIGSKTPFFDYSMAAILEEIHWMPSFPNIEKETIGESKRKAIDL